MAETVDELLIKLKVDMASLEAGLNKGKTQVDSAVKRFANGFNSVGDSAIQSAAAIGKWGIAVGAAVTALGAVFAKQGIEAGAALKETADQVKMSAESLRAFQDSAQDAGIGSEKLTRNLLGMTNRILEAQQGSAQMRAEFDRVGLSWKELAGMNTEARLLAIAEATKKAGNANEQAAVATAAFGAQGARMTTWLSQGSDELNRAAGEFKKLHGAINNLEVERLHAAKTAMGDLGDIAETAKMAFAAGLAPAIGLISEKIQKAITDAGGFGAVIQWVREVAVKAARIIGDAWQGLNIMWEAGKLALLYLSKGVYGLGNAAAKAFDYWADKAGDLWAFLRTGATWVGDSFAAFFALLKRGWSGAVNSMAGIFGSFINTVAEGLSYIPGLDEVSSALAAVGKQIETDVAASSAAASAEFDQSIQKMEASQAAFGAASKEMWAEWAPSGSGGPFEQTMGKLDTLVEESKAKLKELTDIPAGGSTGDIWAAELETFGAIQDAELAKKVETNAAMLENDQATQEARYQLLTDMEAQITKMQEDNAALKNERELATQLTQKQMLLEGENKFLQDSIALEAMRNEQSVLAEQAKNQAILESKTASQEAAIQLEAMKIGWDEMVAAKAQEIRDKNTAAEKKQQMDLAALWKSGVEGKLKVMEQGATGVASILGSAASMMDKNSKSQFEVAKALSYGQAIVSTFAAANMALASPPGPPISFINMSAAIAAGMANVASISQQRFGGAGGGGAPAASAAPAIDTSNTGGPGGGGGAAPINNTQFNIALEGQLFSGTQIRSLLTAMNDQLGDNARIKVN